jgi:hypothetical protein
MIRLERHPKGPRVWVLGRRLHHGRAGQLLAAVGVALMAHDWRDFPWRASS